MSLRFLKKQLATDEQRKSVGIIGWCGFRRLIHWRDYRIATVIDRRWIAKHKKRMLQRAGAHLSLAGKIAAAMSFKGQKQKG